MIWPRCFAEPGLLTSLSTDLLGVFSFVLNRFTGPGKLGIQSMSFSSIAVAAQHSRPKAATAQSADALGLNGYGMQDV